MGGTIAVTVRKPGGHVEPMARWTNTLPGFVNSAEFLNCDSEHIENYMAHWEEMKRDYDTPGKNVHAMTEVYGHWRLKAPLGYGMVLLDFQTKTLLSMQGYTNLLRLSMPMAKNFLNFPDSGEFNRLVGLVEDNRIGLPAYHEFSWEDVDHDTFMAQLDEAYKKIATLKSKNVEEVLLEMSKIATQYNRMFFSFMINVHPWTCREIDESDSKTFYETMVDLGFEFTNEENAIWDEWERNHCDF